jgi:hypothetical protein
MVALAIPATNKATLSVPAASVMAVSMTAAMRTRAMTGAAIAAVRAMGDGESRTAESNGNQTRESWKE